MAMVFVIASNTKAQNKFFTKLKFGIRAGANLTTLGHLNIDISDVIPKVPVQQFDYNYKAGFTAGIFSEISLREKFKLLAEVNYSQKGGNVDGNIDNPYNYPYKLTSKTRVNYIDIPLALAYEVFPKFSVFAGPQASLFLNQKTETYRNGVKENNNNTKSAAVVPSLVAGLGFEFIPKLNVAGKYMRDLAKGTKDGDPKYKDLRNSGFSLTLGYKF